MASEQQVRTAETIIGYTFRSQRGLLFKALTAAGVENEEWDGNRKLAQLGTALTEFLYVYLGYEVQANRDDTTNFRCLHSKIARRAAIAQRTGIDRCIKYSERSGPNSPTVQGKAVNALIGAVFLDSERTILTVLEVMQRLGVFTHPDETVNPSMLSICEVSSFPDVASFAKATLGDWIDCTSLPDSGRRSQSMNAPISAQSTDSGRAVEQTYGTNILGTGNFEDQSVLPLHNDILIRGQENHEESSQNVTDPRQANHRSAMKRKAASSPQPRINALATYLSEEASRCAEHGCPPPEETFYSPSTRADVQDLYEPKKETLFRILVFIASSHSIAALQKVLQGSKAAAEEGFKPLHFGSRLSKAERVTLIQNLDQSMTHLQLLRRYHILELFRESGGPETRSSGGFVMATPQNFNMASNKPGNPSNSAEAEVTAHMMTELFPGLPSDSELSKSQYKKVKNLRKLGQRLHILVETFGKGILGLMLDDIVTSQFEFGISDHMITVIPDSVFRKFVFLLDKSQGGILRDFSAAVTPVVDSLVAGLSPQHEPFPLETVEMSEILRLPKGSPELLRLLTQAE